MDVAPSNIVNDRITWALASVKRGSPGVPLSCQSKWVNPYGAITLVGLEKSVALG